VVPVVNWVVDGGLLVLRDQVDEMAPTRRKGSDGTKGDEVHAARASRHNPEHPPPPGNPDYQVDALDLTHDPARGADMAVITENIRLSRDPRVNLVIFNRRKFSSYAHGEYPAWTWRPHDGDPHEGHAHIEVNDTHHDDTRPWSIGMNPADEKALINRVNSIIDMTLVNPYGDSLKPEPNRLTETLLTLTEAAKRSEGHQLQFVELLNAMAATLTGVLERLDAPERVPVGTWTGEAVLTLQGHAPEVAEAMLDEASRGGQ
jgi:hypothetical protein